MTDTHTCTTQIDVPRLEQLDAEFLLGFSSQIQKEINEWDKRYSKGLEYVHSGGFGKKETLKLFSDAIEYLKVEPLSEYERLYPQIVLTQGTNEGYRVSLYLMRNPQSTPNISSKMIEVLSVKLWERQTQFELYQFIESMLYW